MLADSDEDVQAADPWQDQVHRDQVVCDGSEHLQPLLPSRREIQEEFIVSSEAHPYELSMLRIVFYYENAIRLNHQSFLPKIGINGFEYFRLSPRCI